MSSSNTSLDRQNRFLVRMIAGCFAAVAGLGAIAFMDGRAESALDEALTLTDDKIGYRLEGAHSVQTSFEGLRYTYNFHNKMVFAEQSRHVGFGGAGAGGALPFSQADDPAAIEDARLKGCEIARNQVSRLPSDSLFRQDDYSKAKESAASFAARYCR